MKKGVIFFMAAVFLSLFSATYRWGDSAHSIGTIKAKGGEARHPSFLKGGKDEYVLISTATVIPPYRGDAKVVLEGEPKIDYELRLSGPVIDLGMRRHPRLKGDVLIDLQPKDRIALWVIMRPKPLDPVCGMPKEKDFIIYIWKGREYGFCSEGCRDQFKKDPESFKGMDGVKGKYTLAFYDTKTDKPVLTVPIIFTGKEGGHSGEHTH